MSPPIFAWDWVAESGSCRYNRSMPADLRKIKKEADPMKRIMEDIRTHMFERAYVLYGEEAYLRQDYLHRLRDALVRPGDGLNVRFFTGKDTDPEEVIAFGEQPPFLADYRVIFLEDTPFFKNASDRLAAFMENLPEDLVMVFSQETVDKRLKLFKAAKKYDRVVEFSRMTPEKLSHWAKEVLRHNNKIMTDSDAAKLVARVGTDMGLLRMELEKVISYTGSRQNVTWDDIDAVCVTQIEDRIFDMIRALTNRSREKALALYYDLLALKVPPVKIIVIIGQQYAQLKRAKELSKERLASSELAAKIGVRPFAVKGLMQCAAQYTSEELTWALEEVAKADESFKTGKITDTLAVELLLVKLSMKGTASAGPAQRRTGT